MKFRIRRRSTRTALELPDSGECTFEALESAVGRHCGLARGTYALSLNGRDRLQLGERDSLNDAGIRSGDLIVILETCDSGETAVSVGSSSPVAGRYDCVRQTTAIVGVSTFGQQQQPSEGARAASPAPSSASSAQPVLVTSTDGEVTPACCARSVSSEPLLPPETTVTVPTDRTAVAQSACSQLIAEPSDVSPRAGDCRGKFGTEKSNRCLREPLLVSEATAEQLPRSLTTALQSVLAVDGWSETDALFAVLHVLMIESGYLACELLLPQQLQQPDAAAATASTFLVFCGNLPPAWKTSFGYSVRYVHPLLGDAAAFCVVGMSLGPTTLIVRAMAGNKCLAVTELRVSDYVNRSGTGLNPLKTCRLARLSCLFKDAFAHRLLSVLEELLSPPKDGESGEEDGTSYGTSRYRRWSPDLLRLPAEILFYLLGFLNTQGLVALGATCRLLLGTCRQPLLWRRHYVMRYGLPRVPTLVGFNWYEEYVRRCKEQRQRELVLTTTLHTPCPVFPPWMPYPSVPFDPRPPMPPFFLPSQIDRRVLAHFQPLRRF